MFETEIEQLMRVVRQRTIGDEKAVGLRSIYESNVPGSLKSFFRAEVEWLLEEEHRHEHHTSRFHHELAEVKMLKEQIDAILINSYTFPRSEFENILDRGVHFLLNYLCRPQWTLLSFMLENANNVPKNLIERKLRYCRDYPYFGEILRKYFSHRNISEISYEQLKALLTKIDHEVTKTHGTAELAEIVKPLYSFISYSRRYNGDPDNASVPTRALMYFYDDKGMSGISEILRHKRDSEDLREIAFSRLKFMIGEVKPDAPAKQSKPIDIPKFLSTPIELQGRTKKVFGDDDVVTDFIQDDPAMESDEANAEPAVEPRTNLFSFGEEKAIIRMVFGSDESAFRTMIAAILDAATWEDAAVIIDDYFSLHAVEPFTKEAITFTNIMQKTVTKRGKQ